MLSNFYNDHSRHATWLELFFDLVFVAVFGVIAHDLAHTHDGHISVEQFLRFPLVFIPAWWIWMSHTLYANYFDRDDRQHRLFALVIMALMVVLSIYSNTSEGANFALFAGIYVAIRLLLAGLYLTTRLTTQDCDDQCGSCAFSLEHRLLKRTAGWIAVGALLSLSAIAVEGWLKYVLFYGGIAVDMLGQCWQRRRSPERPVDRRHLVERVGLLAIIILGESVIAMVAGLSQVDYQPLSIVGAITGFVLVGAIWWIYFDSFATLERGRLLGSGNVIIFAHLMLCMGLLILANLIRHSILGDLDRATFGMMAIVGLSAFYLGKQLPYWVAFPPWRKAILLNTLICIAFTVASTLLPRIEYSLLGMAAGMSVYVWLTFRRVLNVDVSRFLDPH